MTNLRCAGGGAAMGRRAFLVASGMAVLATACGADGSTPDAASSPDPTGSSPASPVGKSGAGPATRPPSPPPEPVLPEVRAWRPSDGEIEPPVKVAAVAVIEALGTVLTKGAVPGADAVRSAAQRLAAIEADPKLADRAGALIPPAAPSVVEIVYPQYGGLTPDTASVMAVAAQTWIDGSEPRRRTVTVDVRLERRRDAWVVTALLPVAAVDVASLQLAGRAAELADTSGVRLPDAALADLASGAIDPRVADALLRLSESYEMSVSVFRSGHPENVFGTDRTSNHTRGRAVDIWAVNGTPVVTMATDDPLLLEFLAAAANLGSDEVGGPVDLDGRAGRTHFSDHLHRDHVHIGFETD